MRELCYSDLIFDCEIWHFCKKAYRIGDQVLLSKVSCSIDRNSNEKICGCPYENLIFVNWQDIARSFEQLLIEKRRWLRNYQKKIGHYLENFCLFLTLLKNKTLQDLIIYLLYQVVPLEFYGLKQICGIKRSILVLKKTHTNLSINLFFI